MSKQPNYYRILGLEPGASKKQIEEAARALGSDFPEPLRDPSVNVAYRQLLTAYEVLRDPERRAAYDRQLQDSADELLLVDVEASRQTLSSAHDEQILYLLATLRAPHSVGMMRLPLNLCLVFDRSTSMRGERLQQVKIAARQVIDKLSTGDLISIVTFSDRAEIIVPSNHPNNRQLLEQRIKTIQASGGTEIFQGLKAGVAELRKAPLSGYISHLVLMTDGHTYGDETQALQLARESAEKGITFSAFGIGSGWNDEFLDQLVSPSGGPSGYIEHADGIAQHLREQVQGLGVAYAQNVSMLTTFPSSVTCKYAIKLSPSAQPLPQNRSEVSLGTIDMRTPLSVLLELVVQTEKPGRQLEIPLDFRVTIPSRRIDDQSFSRSQTIQFVPGEPVALPPPMVVRAVQMLTLYRMNEKAWEEMEAGETAKATRRMKRLTSRLEDMGQSELAAMATAETQRLSNMGNGSESGHKKLKYGTRSLLTETMKLYDA